MVFFVPLIITTLFFIVMHLLRSDFIPKVWTAGVISDIPVSHKRFHFTLLTLNFCNYLLIKYLFFIQTPFFFNDIEFCRYLDEQSTFVSFLCLIFSILSKICKLLHFQVPGDVSWRGIGVGEDGGIAGSDFRFQATYPTATPEQINTLVENSEFCWQVNDLQVMYTN